MAKKPTKKIKYPYEYDPALRKKAKAYSRIKLLAGVVNGVMVPIVFLLGFFFLGFSSIVGSFATGFGMFTNPIYIFFLLLLLSVITFPLKFYSGYVYEHKYQLSRHSLKSWFKDYFKGLLLEYVFSIILLTIVYSFIGTAYWWIYAVVLYFFVDVFFSNIWPVLILPFFYKLTPFTDQVMKRKLLGMAKAVGAKNITNVLVAKESDKSVKANALFAGMGKSKRMVLFDTLLDEFTGDEVETVIGHELGHHVHKDIPKGIILSTLLLIPVFYVVHLVLASLGVVSSIVGLPLFIVTISILDLLLLPLENAHTRRQERAADWFGLDVSKKPEAQISTEKRLADQALSDHQPHPFVEWLLYTHPSAEKRIAMVKEWELQNRKKK